MRRHSPAFYDDMVSYEPTARFYRRNSETAARRVHELIEDGVQAGEFRNVNGTFAARVVAVAFDAVQSGDLLRLPGYPPETHSPNSATSSSTASDPTSDLTTGPTSAGVTGYMVKHRRFNTLEVDQRVHW